MPRIPFFRINQVSGSRSLGRRAVLLGTSLAVLSAFGACSADKNYQQRQEAWEEQRAAAADAGVNLPAPAVTRSQQGEWVTSVGDIHAVGVTCIRNCIPDPAPPPVNCDDAESKYQFLAPPEFPNGKVIWSPSQPYTYDDYSADHPIKGPVTMQRCIGRPPDENVLHVFGGPYESWGGGIGRSIHDWWGTAAPPLCSGPDNPVPCESLDPMLGERGRTVDLSQWDGIALWARRGPESQAGIRVTVGDKTTDDDLNIDQNAGQTDDDHINEEQRWCKRSRRCDCSGNSPCSFSETLQGYFCFDPKYQDEPSAESDYQRCGETACGAPYEAGGVDPAFQGKACTPYQLQSGYTRSYCFNPGQDPNPPEATELCGDHFQTPIRLSTEWQLYLVPFSGMRQQAFGKESPGLSTDQISLVRLTFEGGWIDYYIADMRFYRLRR